MSTSVPPAINSDPLSLDLTQAVGDLRLSSDQYAYLMSELELHHSVFGAMVSVGEIAFSRENETAWVSFFKGEPMRLSWNPDFWNKENLYDRVFTVCHEMLHILLRHGYRGVNLKPGEAALANVAMDIVINERLVRFAGFDRSKIFEGEKLCWADTVFPRDKFPAGVSPNETFEYYFGLLLRNAKHLSDLLSSGGGQMVDNHGWMYGGQPADGAPADGAKGDASPLTADAANQAADKVVADAVKVMDQGTVNDTAAALKDAEEVPSGHGSGSGKQLMGFTKVIKPPQRKWEDLFEKFYLRNFSELATEAQWAHKGRRQQFLSNALMLPSDREDQDGIEKNKLELWVFLDVSSSCAVYAKNFWEAGNRIPTKVFNKRLFTFDDGPPTEVKRPEDVCGGGGTSFRPVAEFIDKQVSSGKVSRYPHAVVMITDAEAPVPRVSHPQNWYWMIPTKELLKRQYPSDDYHWVMKNKQWRVEALESYT